MKRASNCAIPVAHTDGDGNSVPSRWADNSELIALRAMPA